MKRRKKIIGGKSETAHLTAESRAFHEAGHAVAACLLRRKFKYVDIKRSGDIEGKIVSEIPNGLPAFYIGSPRAGVKEAEQEILVSLAGPAAQDIHGCDDWEIVCRSSWSDFKDAKKFASFCCDTAGLKSREEDVLKSFYQKARCMLLRRRNWLAVVAVAAALLRKKSLRRTEIMRICKDMWTTRRYQEEIS